MIQTTRSLDLNSSKRSAAESKITLTTPSGRPSQPWQAIQHLHLPKSHMGLATTAVHPLHCQVLTAQTTARPTPLQSRKRDEEDNVKRNSEHSSCGTHRCDPA